MPTSPIVGIEPEAERPDDRLVEIKAVAGPARGAQPAPRT